MRLRRLSPDFICTARAKREKATIIDALILPISHSEFGPHTRNSVRYEFLFEFRIPFQVLIHDNWLSACTSRTTAKWQFVSESAVGRSNFLSFFRFCCIAFTWLSHSSRKSIQMSGSEIICSSISDRCDLNCYLSVSIAWIFSQPQSI